ncbi:MAG: cytochrome c3 family protein [Planctomycetota bacterium]
MHRTLICLVAVSVATLTAGAVQAAHSDHGCFNCHVPHKAGDPTDPTVYGVPLWSTAQSADGLPTFNLYSSKTFDALGTDIGQPDGPTKLCLGCHDGTYHVFPDYMPDSEAIFDADALARSHPVSFTYDTDLANDAGPGLRDPATALSGLPGGGTIEADLLDEKGKMQCTSCHDVHVTGLTDYLLRYDIDTDGEEVMCRVCHDK